MQTGNRSELRDGCGGHRTKGKLSCDLRYNFRESNIKGKSANSTSPWPISLDPPSLSLSISAIMMTLAELLEIKIA